MKDFIYNEETEKVSFGNSDANHIENLMALCKGWHKFRPFVGACLIDHLNDERSSLQLQQIISEEVKKDGATIQNFRATLDGFDIEATYPV